jgi:hypothetical protein
MGMARACVAVRAFEAAVKAKGGKVTGEACATRC